MLRKETKNTLDQLIANSDSKELIWINGYISGLLKDGGAGSAAAIDTAGLVDKLTIIYITDTGNSKFISGEISKKLKEKSVSVKVKAANQYRLADLEKEKNVIFIVSTHGEGELPESGQKFFDHIKNNQLNLSKLNYFVIALGDTNYPLFCQSGKDVDARLTELKAKSLAPRVEFDLDFEDHLEELYSNIFTIFGAKVSGPAPSIAKKSSKNEYVGEILSNTNLNDIESIKKTHHIEIGVEDGITYEVGDSIGILLEGDDDKKSTPRLYSIASSANESENEVHLTVSVVSYVDENGKSQQGLCSGHLSSLKIGEKIKFYISKNRQFKLPSDDKDIIMVGPGTGIAPFRGFLAERNFRDASGKNWLFFGDCTFQNDFLYQTEWQDYLESGLLTRMDVAFSRDQKEKIYVQHRIKEKAQDLYQWIENGAYFYICGDKEKMAKDVENALILAIGEQGNKTEAEAKEFLEKMKEEGRYLTDVY
jgi:sulfite reductase (NADPH) flavoprotein alpha-component